MKIEQKDPRYSQAEFTRRIKDTELNKRLICEMDAIEFNRALIKRAQVRMLVVYFIFLFVCCIWLFFLK